MGRVGVGVAVNIGNGGTEVETITYACHVAYLDPMTGEGLLILPNPDDDVPGLTDRPLSLHAADWDQVMADLDRRGWEPSQGDHGELLYVGKTIDGREAIGLYGRDPIVSMPSAEQAASASAALLEAAQVVPA